jgi:flavin reductase (DIM6/NTAB) family NADH-FMN oxidoreductase RutF
MRQKDAIPAGTDWIEKNIKEFQGSPFDRIGGDWMLITAGNAENEKGNWNTMTASWGGLGVLWNKNVAIVFIRPSRRTFNFANDSDMFTLSFFDESYRSALELCGEKSGRDTDKAHAAGLMPVFFSGGAAGGAISFKEAKEIIVCKKIYTQDIDPALFFEPSIEKNYSGKDYHRMYIGEIVAYFKH